ncbi:MAG: asparaginase domain-containing protein [Methylococcales bacterium]
MVFTSSVPSFMFENLAKPVTGSQPPIADTRTDAVFNFVNAIHTIFQRRGNRIFRRIRATNQKFA